MKVKDVRLGCSYAVRDNQRGRGPIRHVTVVDTVGNTVIGEYVAINGGAYGESLERIREQRKRLYPNRTYDEDTKKLIRVKASDVLCLSDEWQPDTKDGRIEAPVVKYIGGHRIVETPLGMLEEAQA